MESGTNASALSQEVIDLLTARGDTIAVAESLTGGMLAAALTAIPGRPRPSAARWYRMRPA